MMRKKKKKKTEDEENQDDEDQVNQDEEEEQPLQHSNRVRWRPARYNNTQLEQCDIHPADLLSKHWGYTQVWDFLKALLFWSKDTGNIILRKSDHNAKGSDKM
jgi:hypothetical protein